jgi:hypothetical protein
MKHPAVENLTPFAFEALFATDEEGQPLLVTVVKATYAIQPKNKLALADQQIAVSIGGECRGDPDQASYKYEPESAFVKPGTDVVLIGHAHAPTGETRELDVTLRVGSLNKVVRVSGDRCWRKTLSMISMSKPEPFDKIPLIWERSFGGWDRSHPDPEKHSFEPRNPVGVGYRSKRGAFEEDVALPNLEDPRRPLKNYGDTPPPTGFGFTSPSWQPRAAFAGTYDAQWTRQRMPLLPADFDRRFFNAAPADLIAPGFLRGDEPIVALNASPRGKIAFELPGIVPPRCAIGLAGRPTEHVQTSLDTVMINADDDLLLMLWRGNLKLKRSWDDVLAIRIETDNPPAKAGATRAA